MTYTDPLLQEKKKPRDELTELNLAEGLALLNIIGKNIPKKVAKLNPLTVDKAAMAMINKALDKIAENKYKTSFDKCTSEQKVEVLKLTLEAKGTFGLQYDRRMGQKPQTVMEFLASKNGNCADFSRLLITVAQEKKLQVQMVSAVFQAQNSKKEEEQHLAVFNIDGKILYIDLANNILTPYSGFATSYDLIKDQKFQQDILELYKLAVKDGKQYKLAEEPAIISTQEGYQATYWADMGHYYLEKLDWNSAITCFEKALGLSSA